MRRSVVGVLAAVFSAILLVALPVAAQNGTITGTVVDSDTGGPLSGVEIVVQGGGADAGALTNQDGRFSISVGAGTYTIIASNIGYRSATQDRVSVVSGQATNVAISLTSNVLDLDPIVVTVGRKAEKKTEAPATTHIVGSVEISERPAMSPTEHLRAAPGVDIISQGVQSTNVVIRGFNNIFSGALYALTDNRIAGVPSLRVNLLHFLPQTDDDIERMEVVLGPGSALYGPNTANGVLHIITKSPLDYQGTTLTVGGGEQGVFKGSFRTANKVGEKFAFKISGQYLSGDEWEFVDPEEQRVRAAADADPAAFNNVLLRRGLSQQVADLARSRVGIRDNTLERFSVDARADLQVADDGRLSLSYGRSKSSGIELTGIGAAQADGWTYEYIQARLNLGSLFVQTYMNSSNSGDSFLLRDGVPTIDKSRIFVSQLQYGVSLADDRQEFTFGADYIRTNPRTLGTVNGVNEDIDNIDEIGVYLQSETALTDKLDFIFAGRVDDHSFLDDKVFSPRAALVFKPNDHSSFRFTWNRAFSPPTSLNLFLDINAGAVPSAALAGLGYGLRAQGTHQGFSFMDSNGNLSGMRSPFTPAALGGPGQLLPVNVATMWQLGVGVLAAQGAIDPGTAALLGSLSPTAADIGINVLNTSTGDALPLSATVLPDIPKLKESTNQTFEVGYQGVINDRFLVSADVWYSERQDFVSPLVIRTPLLLLNALPAAGPNIGEYLVPILIGAGMPQAQAIATAGALAAGMGQIPLAVVSSDGVNSTGADLLATYVNAGTVKLWGADLALKYLIDDRWTVAGTFSWVEDNYFADVPTAAAFGLEVGIENGIAPVALNAPSTKGSFSVGYRDARAGFNIEARLRMQAEFPAESAGFVGTACITGGNGGLIEEDCVDSFALVDVTMGYKVPNTSATLQLAATNLFDSAYKSFVGVPEIGRFIMLQVKYDMF
jgi:outer membrane receptor for ferrienterochelin and colicins